MDPRAAASPAGHPDDRHVVAAATRGEADVVVTANLKDFPAAVLAAHGLKVEHPDGFLVRLYRESPGRFVEALERVRTRLRNPPVSPEQHLDAPASRWSGRLDEALRRIVVDATATALTIPATVVCRGLTESREGCTLRNAVQVQ